MDWLKEMGDRILERRARQLWEKFHAYLPASGRVLDVGSATGHMAWTLARKTRLIPVETDVVNMSTKTAGPVIFDGERLPFADKSFDAALVLFVLQFARQPVALLREISRVTTGPVIMMQSGYETGLGRIFLRCRTWAFGSFALRLMKAARMVNRECSDSMVPRRMLTRQACKEFSVQAGFWVEHFIPCPSLTGVSRDLYVLRRAA
ncbi:MAG: methyltransferase domain-containing protein [Candidatus Omnitrophota bacterium]|nr:methyltransferase domain-containing protein [Candidatus Omnitrophota bacterium]MDZ4242511.1 methyltransferase domain-containing protein [Candidatus Omnitrophota bacterium]